MLFAYFGASPVEIKKVPFLGKEQCKTPYRPTLKRGVEGGEKNMWCILIGGDIKTMPMKMVLFKSRHGIDTSSLVLAVLDTSC